MDKKQLFVALIACRQFATFERPMRPIPIVAVSHDEAMGKAIAEAKRIWSNGRYSDHIADIQLVPQEMIDQVKA